MTFIIGSMARGTASASSDVGVLVAFVGPATSERCFGVQFFLEDALGRPVDLVTERALRPEFKPFIDLERIEVRGGTVAAGRPWRSSDRSTAPDEPP